MIVTSCLIVSEYRGNACTFTGFRMAGKAPFPADTGIITGVVSSVGQADRNLPELKGIKKVVG
jgi:hypothetical protein